MPAGVPIQGVLFTVFQSIFEVFLLCLAGFTLSFKNIVDKRTSKALNHINVALFTPALLFSKVAFFLTPAKLRQLWVIPIFFTILTVLSAMIAHWLARACRLKRSQVTFATAASMFMNSNSLPVALMQSLVTTVPLLKWGADDTMDAMFGRSLTYLVVFSTLGMILRWSYGIRLISQADEPERAMPPPTIYRDVDDADAHSTLTSVTVDLPTAAHLVDQEAEVDTKPRDRMPWRARPVSSRLPHQRPTPVPWHHTHPHSHLPAVPTSLGDQPESDDSDELEMAEGDSEFTIALQPESNGTVFSMEAEDPAPVPASAPKFAPLPSSSSSSSESNVRSTPQWKRHTRSSFSFCFTRLLTALTSLSPPLIASLLALFCVLAPPVQRLLKSKEMIPFKGALDNAGGCSIPVTMIVLGGWFWDGETKPKGTVRHGPVEEGEVKGGSESDGQGNAKSKGKGVESSHLICGNGNGNDTVPTPLGKWQGHLHTSTTENALPRPEHHVMSLSSMIRAFGDVLMACLYPRGGSGGVIRLVRGNVGPSKGDVEPGLLATHTETEDENGENAFRRFSKSRSQTDPENGHPRISPISSSSPNSQLPSLKSLSTREVNPRGENLTILVTLLARMVIVPLVVTPMMVLVSRLGWGGEVFEDPVFIVSSMLLVSSPPALTLAQVSQRAKATAREGTVSNADTDTLTPFERLLSRTVFWAYCVLTPPVTIASVMVGLFLVDV